MDLFHLWSLLAPAHAAGCDALAELATVALLAEERASVDPEPAASLGPTGALGTLGPPRASAPLPVPMVGQGERLAVLVDQRLVLASGTQVEGQLWLEGA